MFITIATTKNTCSKMLNHLWNLKCKNKKQFCENDSKSTTDLYQQFFQNWKMQTHFVGEIKTKSFDITDQSICYKNDWKKMSP